MSIDIEGYEMNCLKGCDLINYPPKILVIEIANNNSDIADYLKDFGYRLDKKVSYNHFFIHEYY
jgi:hypothetical protein